MSFSHFARFLNDVDRLEARVLLGGGLWWSRGSPDWTDLDHGGGGAASQQSPCELVNTSHSYDACMQGK